MALGTTFWSTNGDTILWYDLSDLLAGQYSGASANWRPLRVGPCKIYQEPMVVDSDRDESQANPGWDSGFFYALRLDSAGGTEYAEGSANYQKEPCDSVYLTGSPYARTAGSTYGTGQWARLQPSQQIGDLLPVVTPDASAGFGAYHESAVYKTGFLSDAGAAPVETSEHMLVVYVNEAASMHWRLWHYNPYAWAGTPPGVMAAAAMKAGLGTSYIDTGSFDDCDDAYDLSTGDAPWTSLDIKWTLYQRREVGVSIIDTILEAARHQRDFIFVNEVGKLAMASFTTAPYTLTGFGLEADQVLEVLSWTLTDRFMFNSVRATWGSATRQSWDGRATVGATDIRQSMTATREEQLDSSNCGKWIHDEANSTLATKYGTRWLKGARRVGTFLGEAREVESVHYPLLLGPHVDDGAGGDLTSWEPADGGGMVHVTNWLTSDGTPRAMLEIRQGPLGWDYALGDELSNVSITGDGGTITSLRCIERTYDFDNLTVDSVLMEVPPNS